MDVKASSVSSVSGSVVTDLVYTNSYGLVSFSTDFLGISDVLPDEYYLVNYNFDISFDFPDFLIYTNVRNINFSFGSNTFKSLNGIYPDSVLHKEQNISGTSVFKGSDLLNNSLKIDFRCTIGKVVDFEFDYFIDYLSYDCVPLTGEESASYQQGYNAGYSAGEQVGESNGYSNGYSDGFEEGEQSGYDSGFEAGEQSGYDSGFEAGKESVDTQSYYDIGYSAGYDAGYLSGYDDGYDDGYDAGWQSYEDKISGWGADTTDYPVLLYDNSFSNLKLFCDVKTGYPQVAYGDYYLPQFNFNVDPNHTYKVVFNSSQYSYTSAYFSGSQRADLVYNMGSLELPWNVGESFAFVQGSSFTSNVRLQSYIYSSISDGSSSGQAVITLKSLNVKVYDYGPSGNTQNHISNQTDQLTGGYNDSKGNSVNNDFSTGLNEFETVEDSLFSTATTGMKDFTFFDISSVPAMVTGMSFVGSIMSGWFTQAGGASGVGIVLSILFSIMLVAMVLGLYRWYQSKGGKD